MLFVRLFACACLDLSVSSSSWGLGGAAVCDCGTPWTLLLPFFEKKDTCARVAFKNVYVSCLVYANDLVLLSETKETLQNCFLSLQKFCNLWHLKINIEKTKVIIKKK